MKKQDLTGMKFGRLFVLYKIEESKNTRIKWKCKCDCGNYTDVFGYNLKNKHTESCGCLKNERSIKSKRKYNKFEIDNINLCYFIINSIICYFDFDSYKKIKDYYWKVDKTNYVFTQRNGLKIYMHRLIMDCPDNMVIDHINGYESRTDNRKCNLRICTNQENTFNRRCKGYYYNNKRKKFVVQIKKGEIHKTIGYYNTEEEAKQARREAELKYFGEYASKKE